jgi:hypothetical protein
MADEATEWEEDCEGDQVDEDEEALAPRYDHALMAGELVRWDHKSHISLWELVHALHARHDQRHDTNTRMIHPP